MALLPSWSTCIWLGKITGPPFLPHFFPGAPHLWATATQASQPGAKCGDLLPQASLLLSSRYLSGPPPPAPRLSPPLLHKTNSWLATRLSAVTQYIFSFLPGRENRSLPARQWGRFRKPRGEGERRLGPAWPCSPSPLTPADLGPHLLSAYPSSCSRVPRPASLKWQPQDASSSSREMPP